MSGYMEDKDFVEMFSGTPSSQVVSEFLNSSHDTLSIDNLADRGRLGKNFSGEIDPGSRVLFDGNVGAILSYRDPPKDKAKGTVIKVRTSSGDTTSHGDLVFIRWDDGRFFPVHKSHLRRIGSMSPARLREARGKDRFLVSSLDQIMDEFSIVGGSKDNDLVHKATKDLWSFKKTEEGYVIERLFNDTGEPLKV